MSLNTAFIALLFFSGLSEAKAGEVRPLCFDLSKKSTKLLGDPPREFPGAGSEQVVSGTDSKTGLDWGRVVGRVKKPLKKVNELMLDPMITRNAKTTTVTTETLPDAGFLTRYRVAIRVKPVFFITLEWEEIWAHSLLEGTPDAPKSILISYQKTQGTSHIRHFCGNILLKEIDKDTTGVFLIENIDADQRDPDEVANGLLGTLKILQP
jgi:hypothetical protein